MLRLWVNLLLLTLSLSGCMAGALVIGTATGVVIAADQRDLATLAQDQKIAYSTNQRLKHDKILNSVTHVSASVFNRVVLLVGQAPAAELRNRAEQLIQAIPHIRRVYNEIIIAKPISKWQRSQDAIITSNLKARFLATSDLLASQIKVVTENSTVYLMGYTTHEQANIATDVARHSTGVKKIVKIVEYLGSY